MDAAHHLHDDAIFYEVVMEARETTDAYLVTGNIKHFPVKPYVVTPKEMLDILNEVINYVKRPPLAISYATPFENLLKASLNNNALTIMKKMERRGFSHVPVLNGGKFIGVFSVGTIFMYILGGNAIENIEKMEIGDFRKYLPFDVCNRRTD